MLKLGKIGSHAVLSHAISIGGHYENGQFMYNFPLSVGLARDDQSFVEIKGRISTGSPHYEDRPCSHIDVDGLIYASSDDSQIIPHPCGFGFTLKNVAFTEIITGPCDKVKHFFSHDSRGKDREHLFYYGMRGNSVYYAITSRVLPTVGPPPLFPDVMFTYRTYNDQRTMASKTKTWYVPWKGDFVIPPLLDLPLVYASRPAVTLDTTAQQFERLFYLVHNFLYKMDLTKICPKAALLPPTHPIFGDLAVEALDSAKFIDANLIAFLYEYESLSKLFGGLGKSAFSGQLADAYLGYNYGLRNQVF